MRRNRYAVIGGLTSDRAIKLVRGLKDLNIVGMDVVEVAPAYDQSEITALAAATLALEMLYIQAAKKGEEAPDAMRTGKTCH
ncbi:arginase family protein [Escherichia coli]